ncbi:hypothetical protein N7540_005004 [Penicillium herquei]|nr:hypothetical protein N7540_005004 [Penicillium herquei]
MSPEKSSRPTTEESEDPGETSSHEMGEKADEIKMVADEPQSEESEAVIRASTGYKHVVAVEPIIDSSNTKNDADVKPQSPIDSQTTIKIKHSKMTEDSATASSQDSSGSDSEIEAQPSTNKDTLAQVPPNAQAEEIPKSNQQAESAAQNNSGHELIDSSDIPSTQKEEVKSTAAAGPAAKTAAKTAKDPKTEVKTTAKSKSTVEAKSPTPKKTPDEGKAQGNEKSPANPKGAKKNNTAAQDKEDAQNSTEPKQGAKTKTPPKPKASPSLKASGKSNTPGDTKASPPDKASHAKPAPKKKAAPKSGPTGKDGGVTKEDAPVDDTQPEKPTKAGAAGRKKSTAKSETSNKSQNAAKSTSKAETSSEVAGEAEKVVKPKTPVQRKTPAKSKAAADSNKSSKGKEPPISKKSGKLQTLSDRTIAASDSESDESDLDAIIVPRKRAIPKVASNSDHKDSSRTAQTAKLRETEATKVVNKRKASEISEPASSSSVLETPKKRKVSFEVSEPVTPDPHHPILKELRSTVALLSGIESIEQELKTPKASYILKKLDARDSLIDAVEEKMNAMSSAIFKAPKNIQPALIRAYTDELGEEPKIGPSWNEFDSDDDDPPTPIYG